MKYVEIQSIAKKMKKMIGRIYPDVRRINIEKRN